jgi:hypothetical protein
MSEKEQGLSEKIKVVIRKEFHTPNYKAPIIDVTDVREAVQRLKDLCWKFEHPIDRIHLIATIDEIFGEELAGK